jgi:hypothetical protein
MELKSHLTIDGYTDTVAALTHGMSELNLHHYVDGLEEG